MENNERKPATSATIAANKDVIESLPFDDKRSFYLAEKGHLGQIPDEPIFTHDDNPKLVWDPARFNFIKLDSEAPETVNPSLWRQCKLTKIGGIFEVIPDRIYQVRNCDLANMTFIESKNGIIVVDPLTSLETAEVAIKLYYQVRNKNPDKWPVVAIIFTHTHIDHFGGACMHNVLKNYAEGKVMVLAPSGFIDHVCSENLITGCAMGRRADYMYGNLLPADTKGDVGTGLGSIVSEGTVTLLEPIPITGTVESKQIGEIEVNSLSNFQTVHIDGLTFEFQLTPNTEAPAEMHFYVQDYNALCTAENAVHNMHNVYSLRGAQIRDALAWSKDLNVAIIRWGATASVLFGVHHWPVWDSDDIVAYLKKQRDLYRYINDQTLRLANLGYKPDEIANILVQVKLPDNLNNDWSLRGYYGSLYHDVKSVYVKHLGWFDGNPATLHPLSPTESGKKYVEFMGGAEKLLEKARKSFRNGEYRWVAEVVNHLVFADPSNTAAKLLQADTLEQLGYQAESGPWRNFYLSGAQELRFGIDKNRLASNISESFLLSIPLDIFFDYMAMLLDGLNSDVRKFTASIKFIFEEPEQKWCELTLENCVLNHTLFDNSQIAPNINATTDSADTVVYIKRIVLYNLVGAIAEGKCTDPLKELNKLKERSLVKIDGDEWKFVFILNHLQKSDHNFNIVTPVDPR